MNENKIDAYEKDILRLLQLLAENIVMYLEVIDPLTIDLSFLRKIMSVIQVCPNYTPNKDDFKELFKLGTPEVINKMLNV